MNFRHIHPISAILHFELSRRIAKYNPKSILDVGGKGKLQSFISNCPITDANKTQGIDGTCLPFLDKSFDAVISIATLEHVLDQNKLLLESQRVSRKASIHWFPYGEGAVIAEKFKSQVKGYRHPSVIPDNISKEFGCLEHFITLSEHFLLLATIYREQFNNAQTYDFISKYGHLYYGVILEGESS